MRKSLPWFPYKPSRSRQCATKTTGAYLQLDLILLIFANRISADLGCEAMGTD